MVGIVLVGAGALPATALNNYVRSIGWIQSQAVNAAVMKLTLRTYRMSNKTFVSTEDIISHPMKRSTIVYADFSSNIILEVGTRSVMRNTLPSTSP